MNHLFIDPGRKALGFNIEIEYVVICFVVLNYLTIGAYIIAITIIIIIIENASSCSLENR